MCRSARQDGHVCSAVECYKRYIPQHIPVYKMLLTLAERPFTSSTAQPPFFLMICTGMKES